MKVLDNVIKFGNAFGKLTQRSQIAVVGVLIFTAFTMGNCNGTDKLDKFIVEYNAFKETAKQTSIYADSLKTQAVQLSDSSKHKDTIIKKLTVTISFREKQKLALNNNLFDLENRLDIVKQDTANVHMIVGIQDSVITNLKSQVIATDSINVYQKQIIDTQNQQSQLLQHALYASTNRGDSLQTILSAIPPTPQNPNRIFGIKLPSRKTSFLVGTTVGIVSGLILLK
jgi:hypothetical protein